MPIKITFPARHHIQQRARVPQQCRAGYQRYTVVAGDTFAAIARRLNVSVDFLAAENPHIADPSLIYPGDVLCVPPVEQPPGGRVPASCPGEFERYTVRPGDTINRIAQRLGVDPLLLIENNPHITDPGVIFPGDVLCVPVAIAFPCCAVLAPADPAVPADAIGSALVQRLADGRHSLTITAANLPDPSTLGDFNAYEASLRIPGDGGFGGILRPDGGQPPVWTLTIELRPLLVSGITVAVSPLNTETGVTGPAVLRGNLSQCQEQR